jgi:hypothetical protein
MERINLYAAWIGILIGTIAGAIQGMFFHEEKWLGGYSSWKRRMIRLGHISFFGIGFINFTFALTVSNMNVRTSIFLPSTLFIIGAVTMPIICYLSAYKKFFRNLFFIPVLSILVGIILFIFGGLFK